MRPHLAIAVLLAVALTACGHAPPTTDAGPIFEPRPETFEQLDLDLLVMVDNSGSMRENQSNLLAQLGPLLDALTNPPCTSRSNPTPHRCDATSDEDLPAFVAARSIHFGVVSSDLGTPGSSVPGCANTDLGDDGLLNPIRFGQALARHEPSTSAPPTYGRPTDCDDPNQFPSFLAYDSAISDPATFAHDMRCNAGLYVNGCGLESQLDAVYRALVIHDARESTANTSPNAGFVREHAVLAILVLTDEEDGSVRDCRFANGEPCESAIDVYNPASTAWPTESLNLRTYLAQPCSPEDPTWSLDRYVDPADPTRGWLSLKPGHPERIVFAAITGVPLAIPTVVRDGETRTDWDGLLGVPGATGPNDFCGRDSSQLGSLTSAEGPISMRQSNMDLNCETRVVPACRREGSQYMPTACTADLQYFAWPGRRIVEVARRFDEAKLCAGQPCRNGMVASICARDYSHAITDFVAHVRTRMEVPRCLARPLTRHANADGSESVACRIREVQRVGVTECDHAWGRLDVAAAERFVFIGSDQRLICEIAQLDTDAVTHAPRAGVGWWYETRGTCAASIGFSEGLAVPGTLSHLECVASGG